MKAQFASQKLKVILFLMLVFAVSISGLTVAIFIQSWVRSSELLLTSVYDEILTNNERSLRYKLDRASSVLSLNKITIFEKNKLNEERSRDGLFSSYIIALPIYSNVGNRDGYLGDIRFFFSTKEVVVFVLIEMLIVSLFGVLIYFYFKRYFEQKLQQELLTQKKLELGDLAAKMAHDIRSPLSLLMAVSSQNSRNIESSNQFIKIAVDRINAIAEDLLAKRKCANQVNVVTDFYGMLEEVIKEKKIEFGTGEFVSIAANIPGSRNMSALGNANEIKRILSNLINNSFESLEGDRRIEISAFAKGEHLFVVLKDYGKGIPKDLLQRLGVGEVTSKGSGNGLGLLFAKKYLDSISGGLEIVSEVGMGTVVTLRFQRL